MYSRTDGSYNGTAFNAGGLAYARYPDSVKYPADLAGSGDVFYFAGVPVTGFIDRIDERDGHIIVFDYKTGKPENIITKMKAPDDTLPEGGDYWRQMVFYDLLLQQDPRIRKRMTKGYVHALEPKKDGTFVERSIEITESDREIVTQQIVSTYQGIQNMEFSKGCGECDWCKMHGIVPSESDESESSEA